MGFLDQEVNDRYAIYNGDSMEMMAGLPANSIHASIYSPPFGGLYNYSSDDRDLSNARDYEEFGDQYKFFIKEIKRITMPGRMTAVHAAPVKLSNTGRDSMSDLPGDIIRWHQDEGFEWVARHVIWKEPLAVRNRTMAKDLAHKTIVDDGTRGGLAVADELLVFRKPGETKPAAHPNGLTSTYAGEEQVPEELHKYRGWEGDQKQNRYSHWIWRRYASSVWDDVRMTRVLPFQPDPEDDDAEKHVHPLQLDVIERFIDLRTVPGERVLTPFMGVGSEVFAAVRMGRYGIGAELKPSYYRQAVLNLGSVDVDRDVEDTPLFDLDGAA